MVLHVFRDQHGNASCQRNPGPCGPGLSQAYPWMTGKQLADAVLTTASNDFVAPDAAVLYGSQEMDRRAGCAWCSLTGTNLTLAA